MSIATFAAWFQSLPGSGDYMLARGQFVDSTGVAGQRVAIIQQQGGRRPVDRVQFPQIRLTLMGRRDQRGDVLPVESFAESVVQAAIETGGLEQCIIHLTPLGSIMGPYYTAENRVVYGLNFELIR